MATAKDWTWLVFMAGDNDLRSSVDPDIREMERSNPANVRVGIQSDVSGQNTVRRVIHGKGKPQSLGENANAGNASVLTDFLTWGRRALPTTRYVVDVWNHGSGWLDFTLDQLRRRPRPQAEVLRFTTEMSHILFSDAIATAIGADETAQDFLDNDELRKALRGALAENEKFAILACDACYMNMIEVAHQVRDCAEIYVASEEEELSEGWPYDAILTNFHDGLSVERAAEVIVDAYKASPANGPRATLSAVRLDRVDAVAQALDRLGVELMKVFGTKFDSIARARAATYKLQHNDYIDLGDFARNLQTHLDTSGGVITAAVNVAKSVDDAVLAISNDTATVRAFGLAFYLPNAPVDGKYGDLSLSKAAPRWADFVTHYGDNR